MLSREHFLRNEAGILAPYAVHSADSRGRAYPEAEHAFRLPFQRDRDRIIHSTAFRRLEYKTQVFVNHEGDYYRTRLTHTMEASQITRTVARSLRLNEDLAEAIVLSHDLGHTPFGHAGERVLDELLEGQGGFEHNAQSLRIVTRLEHRYPQFPGLNLSWEVREGIAKHSAPYDRPGCAEYEPGAAPSLEAQLVDFADEIAYSCHDLDDGLKSGLLEPDQLLAIDLWRRTSEGVLRDFPAARPNVARYQTIRRIIDYLVTDLIETTQARLDAERIADASAVRSFGKPLVSFSPSVTAERRQLKAFLFEHLYRHHRVIRMIVKAQKALRELFVAYSTEPALLPPHILERHTTEREPIPRVVADYLAGMTDRFALDEHRKVFDPAARV